MGGAAPGSGSSASPALSIMGGAMPTGMGTATALGPNMGQQGGSSGVNTASPYSYSTASPLNFNMPSPSGGGAPGSASTNPILDILSGMRPQQNQGGGPTPSPTLAAIAQALMSFQPMGGGVA